MRTRVKICGITRLEDAEAAVKLGADALGFNFYAPSPRHISPAAARKIIRELPPLVTAVGVFANETECERVAAIAREAGVTTVQLHGPGFPPLNPMPAGLALIRAVPVGNGFRSATLADLKADLFLLDTFDAKLSGGTGRRFEWSLARDASRYGTIILAGGLAPENVAEAIREVRPYAVDVASGVEAAPGVKDHTKLRAFFREVERADKSIYSSI